MEKSEDDSVENRERIVEAEFSVFPCLVASEVERFVCLIDCFLQSWG